MKSIANLLSSDDIEYIINLPEVYNSKNKLLENNLDKVYFSINIPTHIKSKLNDIGLDLTNISDIPMRWIRGDTKPHIDNGMKSFQNTYLVYLTDSPGEFIIDNNSYPISKGYAYVFPEGLSHETINTGSEPRLLLGPMSEIGFPVGTGFNYPGGTTVYIRQLSVGTNPQYSIDNVNWNDLIGYSVGVYNSDTSLGLLKIEFITDITFDSSIGGEYGYFNCGSDNIQFGSSSLKNDGTRPIIYINGISNYPGFIRNGTINYNGYNNILVFNLDIRATNGSTLLTDGGWVAQSYFGKGATNNFIINCTSNGLIIDGGGGIVGGYAGSESGATLWIMGSSSTGNTATYSGGIVGFYAGRNGGQVICYNCWKEFGAISGTSSGGIFGYGAGNDGGYARAVKCYTKENISGDYAGGIFGHLAATSGQTDATDCYSQGQISGDTSGGIYGRGAASDGGTSLASNCYSSGNLLSGVNNGIFAGGTDSYRTATNCYIANGSWSDLNANSNLAGNPNPIVGTTWVSIIENTPYELSEMGYTPYTLENIVFEGEGGVPILKKSYTQTISPGDSTISAIRNGYSYDILSKSGGNPSSYSTITMNDNTGVISTSSSTAPGTYTITLRNTGSYNITTFSLTISGSPPIPCMTGESTVLTENGYVNIADLKVGDIIVTSDNRKVQIENIYYSEVEGNVETYPCIVPVNSLGENLPEKEFRISQGHLIIKEDKWIVPKEHFELDTTMEKIKYYHIKLPNYVSDHLVVNNGVIVESLGKGLFDTIEYYKRQDKKYCIVIQKIN